MRFVYEFFFMIVIFIFLLVKFIFCVQGEFVFVMFREVKDVLVVDVKEYILGYIIGNDIFCCMYQFLKYLVGQFFFVKVFDKFVFIGLIFISFEVFGDGFQFIVVMKVNGEIR